MPAPRFSPPFLPPLSYTFSSRPYPIHFPPGLRCHKATMGRADLNNSYNSSTLQKTRPPWGRKGEPSLRPRHPRCLKLEKVTPRRFVFDFRNPISSPENTSPNYSKSRLLRRAHSTFPSTTNFQEKYFFLHAPNSGIEPAKAIFLFLYLCVI